MSDKTPAGHVPDEECYAARAERAGREKAERERDAALVAGAALLRAARKALRRYGRHDDGSNDHFICESDRSGPETCDCGLDAALAALKEAP